jgi:hypothetical protein
MYLTDVLTLFVRLFVQGMSKLYQRDQISNFQMTCTCARSNHPLCARSEALTAVFLRAFKFVCNETNLMHCLSSVYSVTIPLHASGSIVAHHQEATMYICDNWYVFYIYTLLPPDDGLLASPKHVGVFLILNFRRVQYPVCQIWVSPRRLVYTDRRFGTICQVHLQRLDEEVQ